MLRSRLPKITVEMRPLVEAALRLGAEQIADAAKDRVPVRTGALRDSIHVVRDGELEFMVRAGDTDAFYGHIVEHGSVNSSPHPFLIPAIEAKKGQVVKDVRAAINRAAR